MTLDIRRLEDSEHVLDVLLQCEDILDSLDAYSFVHWILGEVVEGPIISRHWVKISLLYPYRKMPDPRAALRFMKHGMKVDFKKIRRKTDKKNPVERKEQEEDKDKNLYWLVEIKFPRRLLKKITDDLEEYDDDVDVDDVEQAKDSGVDLDSAFKSDEGQPDDFAEPPPPEGGAGGF